MVTKPKTIIIDPDSELGRLLKDADVGPLLLESAGMRYRLERVGIEQGPETRTLDNLWDDYDPDAVRAAILAAAGTWADVDTEDLKEYLYRRRAEGTRPREDT
jgi:hypothetical protein